jgi:hypothetical protein
MAPTVIVAAIVLAGTPASRDAAATVAGARSGSALGYPYLGNEIEARYQIALTAARSQHGDNDFNAVAQSGMATTYDDIVAHTRRAPSRHHRRHHRLAASFEIQLRSDCSSAISKIQGRV